MANTLVDKISVLEGCNPNYCYKERCLIYNNGICEYEKVLNMFIAIMNEKFENVNKPNNDGGKNK